MATTTEITPAGNTGFASGGVTCKLGALCSETRPNAKPENVSGNYLIDSLSASGNINKKGRHLSQYRA